MKTTILIIYLALIGLTGGLIFRFLGMFPWMLYILVSLWLGAKFETWYKQIFGA